MKNFRVKFLVDENHHEIDFSMEGNINDETKEISAETMILKNYPKIDKDRIEIIDIYDIDVW